MIVKQIKRKAANKAEEDGNVGISGFLEWAGEVAVGTPPALYALCHPAYARCTLFVIDICHFGVFSVLGMSLSYSSCI